MMGLYLALGIMIPIRLGTVAILQLMVASGLVNTLTALVLVYTAQGLPLAVFILSEFMKQVSDDLKNAGRIDGLSEYRIFFRLVLPLVRPSMATVAVFTMIPIWNDLWFPLILAPSEATKTITLGAQLFIGQYVTNWNAVLAALSLAILPVLDPLPHLLAAADPRHHLGSGEVNSEQTPARRRRRPRQYGPQPRARLSHQSGLRDRSPRQPLRRAAARRARRLQEIRKASFEDVIRAS